MCGSSVSAYCSRPPNAAHCASRPATLRSRAAALPIALNPHTVELFRSAGLEAALRQATVSPKAFSHLDCPWSGVGQKPAWLALTGAQRLEPGQDSFSPSRGILSAQSAVAALLRARTEVLGSDLRFGTRLVAFEPDATAEDGMPPFTAQFQPGRAYFAGRAARTLTVPAVFALNLDLQEAHNLAWKLAYVVKGLAGPALLATYEAERRPLAPAASAVQHTGTRGQNH